MRPVAVELDALADTQTLWQAWLADAARRYGAIAGLDPGELPADRAAASAELDEWAERGIGDWRAALERFAEDHAAVHVRRDASAAAALRKLVQRGAPIGVFTDAPEALAHVVLRQLGAARRLEALETGADALERLRERLQDAIVVRSRADLLRAADYDS